MDLRVGYAADNPAIIATGPFDEARTPSAKWNVPIRRLSCIGMDTPTVPGFR